MGDINHPKINVNHWLRIICKMEHHGAQQKDYFFYEHTALHKTSCQKSKTPRNNLHYFAFLWLLPSVVNAYNPCFYIAYQSQPLNCGLGHPCIFSITYYNMGKHRNTMRFFKRLWNAINRIQHESNLSWDCDTNCGSCRKNRILKGLIRREHRHGSLEIRYNYCIPNSSSQTQ